MAMQGVERLPGPEDRLMSSELLDQIGEALQAAYRMSHALDQLASIRELAGAPAPSSLTAQLQMALQALGAMEATAAPPERVDLQVFPLETLTPEFVVAQLRERGWDRGTLVVGSAQAETLVRRMLAQAEVPVTLAPFSAARHVDHPQGWALTAEEL